MHKEDHNIAIGEINYIWAKKNRIKELKGGKSVEDIAKDIGMEKGSLSKIVQGTINVYLHRLVQIAQAIGVKPADLLPSQWQSEHIIQETFEENQVLEIINEIIETVEFCLQKAEREMKPEDKANLIIALYKETKNKNKAERNDKVVEITNFLSKNKVS